MDKDIIDDEQNLDNEQEFDDEQYFDDEQDADYDDYQDEDEDDYPQIKPPKTGVFFAGLTIAIFSLIAAKNLVSTALKNIRTDAHYADNAPNNAANLGAGMGSLFSMGMFSFIGIVAIIIAIICYARFKKALDYKRLIDAQKTPKEVKIIGAGLILACIAIIVSAYSYYTISTDGQYPVSSPYYASQKENFSGKYYGGDCANKPYGNSNSYAHQNGMEQSFAYDLVNETLCQIKAYYKTYGEYPSQTQLSSMAGGAISEDVRNGVYRYVLGPTNAAPNSKDIVIMYDKVCYKNEDHNGSITVYSPLLGSNVRVCGFMIFGDDK